MSTVSAKANFTVVTNKLSCLVLSCIVLSCLSCIYEFISIELSLVVLVN